MLLEVWIQLPRNNRCCYSLYFPQCLNIPRTLQELPLGLSIATSIPVLTQFLHHQYNYEQFTLPMSTIVEATRTMDEDDAIKIIKRMGVNYKFNFDLAAQLLEDHLQSRNTLRNQAEYLDNAVFGMNITISLMNILRTKK
ncbi:hypothetical protein H8B09_10215 [Paenibacillus sp. PR3]|uniref:Uncharacterized protein n=1 Tax=Paenibacillus terricola TaxID=2763503 RepID=A0ABR8MY59_9BACL|nr:hypothetical protein [Paenibacillus terricola]MBD3919129.1 hypothetical protein [Paenibacillus terricola]